MHSFCLASFSMHFHLAFGLFTKQRLWKRINTTVTTARQSSRTMTLQVCNQDSSYHPVLNKEWRHKQPYLTNRNSTANRAFRNRMVKRWARPDKPLTTLQPDQALAVLQPRGIVFARKSPNVFYYRRSPLTYGI